MVYNIIKDNLRYIKAIIFQLFNLHQYIRYKIIDTFGTKKQTVNLERLLDMATKFSIQTFDLLKGHFYDFLKQII